MPNGTLPAAGYLGDGQRTTSEFQGGIDEVLAYIRSLKAEVDALSSTVIKEAAVRGVGTTLSDLVETSQLNTRLATTGNLGSAAKLNLPRATTNNFLGTYGVNAGTRARPTGGLGLGATGGPLDMVVSVWAKCITSSAIEVIPYCYNPPAGKCSVYFITNTSGDYAIEIFNNTGQYLEFTASYTYIEVT